MRLRMSTWPTPVSSSPVAVSASTIMASRLPSPLAGPAMAAGSAARAGLCGLLLLGARGCGRLLGSPAG